MNSHDDMKKMLKLMESAQEKDMTEGYIFNGFSDESVKAVADAFLSSVDPFTPDQLYKAGADRYEDDTVQYALGHYLNQILEPVLRELRSRGKQQQ